MTETEDFSRSYHVQRLNRPFKGPSGPLDTLRRAIGTDMKFNQEARDILNRAFEFDYMGAAEYEFGVIPKVIRSLLVDCSKLESFSFSIERDDIAKNKTRKWLDGEEPPPAQGPATIYVLCRTSQKVSVEKVIRAIAADKHKLHEYSNMDGALDPLPGHRDRTAGWLEIDNGFFWFSDEEMWKNTCSLFGLEVS